MPTALITGAGGGIGSAIATALAPTHTLLLGGRPSKRLDAVAERLGATTFPLDMTDTDEIEASCEIVDELDVLVHNAGLSIPGRVAESSVEEWRTTFDVNVFGAVALTLTLLPALRSARGQVVFINSGTGRKASPIMASYSAASSRYAGSPIRCVRTSPNCGLPRFIRAAPTALCSVSSWRSRAASTTPPNSCTPTPSRPRSPMRWPPHPTVMSTKW